VRESRECQEWRENDEIQSIFANGSKASRRIQKRVISTRTMVVLIEANVLKLNSLVIGEKMASKERS
jgi:hypothetical protein